MHDLFGQHAASLEDVLVRVCRRAHVPNDQNEDFAQDVRLHLLQHPEVLESFRSQCQVRTYLFRVISNLLVNWRARRLGRWRPSRQAGRMGHPAIALERLVDRDGVDTVDAIEQLVAYGVASRPELSEIAKAFDRPRVHRRGPVRDTPTHEDNSPARVRTWESAHDATLVQSWMTGALGRLDSTDRDLLNCRFCVLHCAKTAAARHGMTLKQYYACVERILARLRREAVMAGIDHRLIESLIDCRALAEVRLLE